MYFNNDNVDSTSKFFYGIYIPPDVVVTEDYPDVGHVYANRFDALAVVKKIKKARFKGFQTYDEARHFSMFGGEPTNCFPENESMSGLVGEKPSQFKGPKAQELVKLRKMIETGDLEQFRKTVWDNPRYLISSGDTPAILQEGSRYNGLHIATKAMNSNMCELILNTVSNPEFMQLLYGDDNLTACQERADILLDLYLNMPDKGLNETPLHFAVKFGAVGCVEVLTSYPQCDRSLRNKYNNLAKEMICQRNNNDPHIRTQIAAMLEERFYVPVLRNEDNSVQPMIGEPFSPNSPPRFRMDPMSPRLEIRAYAGPMSKQEAADFRKVWKTPPVTANSRLSRSLQLNRSFQFNRSLDELCSPKRNLSYRVLDSEKGLERFGRELAHELKVQWKEYWPFLDTFVDFSTKEGLDLLEKYIADKYNAAFSRIYEENSFDCLSVTENGKKEEKLTEKKWSPIQDLCAAFRSFRILSGSREDTSIVTNNNENESSNPNLSPFLCIEKSLQVLATRIFNSIMSLPSESLNNEFKHFRALISSYMDDTRFSVVDFRAAHCRLAHIVSQRFKQQLLTEEYLTIIQILYEMIDDRNSNPYKNVDTDDDSFINQHKVCIIQRIIEYLESTTTELQKQNVNSENECKDVWDECRKCFCSWEELFFKRNSRKTSSRTKFKKNMAHNNSVSKRLIFDGCCENDEFSWDKDCFQEARMVEAIIDTSGDTVHSSDDEENFVTPPESRAGSTCSDKDEEMFDVTDEGAVDIFIEGNVPSKVDFAVYHAIKDVEIVVSEYPNIYRWRHAIQLYSEDERDRWRSPINRTYDPATSTPKSERGYYGTSQRSWMRVTGVEHSPRSASENWKRRLKWDCN